MQDFFALLNETVRSGQWFNVLLCATNNITLILQNKYSHDAYKCNMQRI